MTKVFSICVALALLAGCGASGGQRSLTMDEPLPQQWALFNDGSFHQLLPQQYIEESDGSRKTDSPAEPVSAVAGIDINVKEAWSIYDGGSRDVVIALIDTGIDYTHPELQGAIWTNAGEIPGNNVDDDGNGYVDDVYGWNFCDDSNQIYINPKADDHGTHAAGTIAASSDDGTGFCGIVDSDHVKIMSVKVLEELNYKVSIESVIQAIRYAEANGASICNLSLGTSKNDPALYQAIAESSMLFVIAAGNDGTNNGGTPCYPASYDLDNIISVANLNYNGTLHPSSNYDAVSVDLAAPGTQIFSTMPENYYEYMTGTSMAAPMVTAAAAMLYSYHADITLDDVKEILLASVTKLDSLSGKVASGGMLNLGAAMAYDTGTLSHKTWNAP